MSNDSFEQLLELERRREISEGLRGILAVLNSNEPLNAILDYITASASRLLRADAVAIYRLQPGTSLLTIQSSHGLSKEFLAYSAIPLGQAATGQAALEGKPVLIPDVYQLTKEYKQALVPQVLTLLKILSKQYRAMLAVPLVIKQEIVGTLTLYYAIPRTTEQEEMDLAVSFCNQAALAIENARLREKVLEEAVAAERNRIARDLHDSVTQTLFSASLIAEVLPAIWGRDPQEAAYSLSEFRQVTRGALAEMRTLLLELRPAGLVEGHLEDLIKQLAEGISGRTREPIIVQVKGEAVLPLEVKLVFYRIAQEALNNLAKHANAQRGEVEICSLPARRRRDRKNMAPVSPVYSRLVAMTICDNGCGFDPRTVTSDHLGLGIMRERALGAQALLSIRSKPGEGTEVRLVWPASNKEVMA